MNRHFRDSLARQHPAQDRACCPHTEGHPRFPDLRPIGTPIPVPDRIGKRGFAIPDSGRVGNRGFPSPIPGQIGNRGNGNRGFPGLRAPPAAIHCQVAPPLADGNCQCQAAAPNNPRPCQHHGPRPAAAPAEEPMGASENSTLASRAWPSVAGATNAHGAVRLLYSERPNRPESAARTPQKRHDERAARSGKRKRLKV